MPRKVTSTPPHQVTMGEAQAAAELQEHIRRAVRGELDDVIRQLSLNMEDLTEAIGHLSGEIEALRRSMPDTWQPTVGRAAEDDECDLAAIDEEHLRERFACDPE